MPPVSSLAVLPFVNLGPDATHDYLADGMTEEIIHALTRLENLKVTSRTSSFFFKNKTLPLTQIAEQLNVQVVLEGSVRVANNTLRVVAQLIEAKTDFHFWAESWDRPLDNIFEVQDQISLLIAEKLRENFGHLEIQDHLIKPQTTQLSAYQLYLQGRQQFNLWNPQSCQQAISLFEQVLALEPRHADALVGLADAHGFLAVTGAAPNYAKAWGLAQQYTEQALTIDPHHAGAYYQLANVAFFTQANYRQALAHALEAVRLSPAYPEAQQFLAFLYILAQQHKKGWHHLQLALELDPLNPETLFYQAFYQYRTGQYAQALRGLQGLMAQNPHNLPAAVTMAYVHLMLQQPQDALQALNQLAPQILPPGDGLGVQFLAHHQMQHQKQAQSLLAQLQQEAQQPTAFQQHTYLYMAYAVQGQAKEAFDWLDQAIQMQSSILLLGFSDPLAQGLRSHPRYQHFHQKLYGAVQQSAASPLPKKPLLTAPQTQQQARALSAYVQQEQPYLNPQLSLRGLAQQLQMHPNTLSWLLNEHLGQNFNHYINSHRVNHFKALALDPANAHISLIGLAFESGFNSKTVFNTYFKKLEGQTPKVFLQQHQS